MRRARDAALISSFRPAGTVKALALSQRYVIVLVQSDGTTRIEWYDARSGEKLGTHPLPAKATPRISASDQAIVFAMGKAIHALDLPSGRDHRLWRAANAPLSLSISGTRIVWGENSGNSASILTLTLP